MSKKITHLTLDDLRDMIADGWTDEMIASFDAERANAEHEAMVAADEYHQRYGDDYDDDARDCGSTAEYNDRLSMGRNDAGEWLGFM